MICWLRDLEVIFTSSTLKRSVTFGSNWKENKEDLSITVTGNKYLSSVKDKFVVTIDNLTYGEIILLTAGKFFTVEIKSGYRSQGNSSTIFKGAVAYFSMRRNNDRTNSLIAICTSTLLAKYGQSRMNMTLSSGINMYSALTFLAKRMGIKNANIDNSFKNRIFREETSISGTAQSWIETLCEKNTYVTNTDESSTSPWTLINPYKNSNRLIKLNSSNIVMNGGYPKLSTDGITFTMMPTLNLIPGDVIQIDNDLIDTSVDSYDTQEFTKTIFMNSEGKYMIYQLDYNLANRSGEYTVRVHAKNRDIYTKVIQSGVVAGYGAN